MSTMMWDCDDYRGYGMKSGRDGLLYEVESKSGDCGYNVDKM